MRTILKAAVAALTITAGCGASTSGHACDVNSPTDISCGPANINPANPLSPMNPINQYNNSFYNRSNPYSPYFSTPVYAYGILGLLEGEHPTMIYPAGPPRLCRLGVDCPNDGSRPAQAAYQPPEDASAPHPARPGRHHRRHRPAQ